MKKAMKPAKTLMVRKPLPPFTPMALHACCPLCGYGRREARRARESEAGKFWSTVDGKVIGEQEAEIAALRTALKGVEREAVTYLEERNAAEARLSEIVKSLAAAVTKEKP